MQSLVMTGIFYGWGLNQYNRMGPLSGVLLGLGFFTLQMALAPWWLKRFHFGPVEWLWRSITYLRWQPFRKRMIEAQAGLAPGAQES